MRALPHFRSLPPRSSSTVRCSRSHSRRCRAAGYSRYPSLEAAMVVTVSAEARLRRRRRKNCGRMVVEVGTRVALCPPHRSRCAVWPAPNVVQHIWCVMWSTGLPGRRDILFRESCSAIAAMQPRTARRFAIASVNSRGFPPTIFYFTVDVKPPTATKRISKDVMKLIKGAELPPRGQRFVLEPVRNQRNIFFAKLNVTGVR